MGGKAAGGQAGGFMQPNILADVREDNPVYHQEFFGPVALFFRVPDEAAAIALANDSPFGLGGSVFTQDIERQTGGAPDRHRHGVHQFRRRVDA